MSTIPPVQFTVRVDAAMTRLAWRAWFFRRHRVVPLAIACLFVLCASLLDYARAGALRPVSIAGLSVSVLSVLLYGTGYVAGLRRALAKLSAIAGGQATYTLTPSTVAAESSLGSVAVAWPAVAELRKCGDLIIMEFRGADYTILPAAQIPAEALAFLIQCCETAGARLVGLPAAAPVTPPPA